MDFVIVGLVAGAAGVAVGYVFRSFLSSELSEAVSIVNKAKTDLKKLEAEVVADVKSLV